MSLKYGEVASRSGQGAGCRVQVSVCRVQGAGCRVQGVGCRVQGAGCRVQRERESSGRGCMRGTTQRAGKDFIEKEFQFFKNDEMKFTTPHDLY